MSEIRICKYCGMELLEDVPHGLRNCHLRAVARIAELEMKIRHNALWQASEDAEERAHLEKLVPDLKKRIADLEARAEKAEAMVEKLNSWVEKLMDVGWGMWRESNFGGHETLNEIRWEQLANIISKERER